MSKCPECRSGGDCESWCGTTSEELSDQIDDLCEENKKLKKMVFCTYTHEHTINKSFFCNKCGWSEHIKL